MGTFAALLCHMVPGSSGQKASSLMNLYNCDSDPLKSNFGLSWLIKDWWLSRKVQGARF